MDASESNEGVILVAADESAGRPRSGVAASGRFAIAVSVANRPDVAREGILSVTRARFRCRMMSRWQVLARGRRASRADLANLVTRPVR